MLNRLGTVPVVARMLGTHGPSGVTSTGAGSAAAAVLMVTWSELVVAWLFRQEMRLDGSLLAPVLCGAAGALLAAVLGALPLPRRPGFLVAWLWAVMALVHWVRTRGHPTRWEQPLVTVVVVLVVGAVALVMLLRIRRRLVGLDAFRFHRMLPGVVAGVGLGTVSEIATRTLGSLWRRGWETALVVTVLDLAVIVFLCTAPWVGMLFRTRARRWGVSLAMGALLFAGARASASSVNVLAKPSGDHNVVLVIVDSLRADRVGSSEAPHPATPNLSALAARGARWTDHRSAADGTLWALPAILQGTPTPPPPIARPLLELTLLGRRFVPFGDDHLVKDFASRGYQTHLMLAWADVLEARPAVGRPVLATATTVAVPTLQVTGAGHFLCAVLLRLGRAAAECTERPSIMTDPAFLDAALLQEPFMLLVHMHGPHAAYPHAEPRRFFTGDEKEVFGAFSRAMQGSSLDSRNARGLAQIYDDSVLLADAEVGKLVEALDRAPLSRRTILAVTSDHGEMLGEHGRVLHGRNPYEPALRVPLIVVGPGITPGTVVDAKTQHSDVRAMLGALANGQRLEDLVAGHLSDRVRPFVSGGGYGAVRGTLKVWMDTRTAPATPVAFDLAEDPGEDHPRPISAGSQEAALLAHAAELLGQPPPF
ncbi:MAG: sulfatase-like hydrolase/transferase [Myxococcota bacterium]